MRTSIATVCLSGTLAEKLDAVAAAGFDGIEILHGLLHGGKASRIGRLFATGFVGRCV
mgnify:CR=1 FL=1